MCVVCCPVAVSGVDGELDAIAACFTGRTSMRRGFGDHLWRTDGGAGGGEPGQRLVDARCRFVLADDREGGILALALVVWIDVVSGLNQR
jgi:hypothetical protein